MGAPLTLINLDSRINVMDETWMDADAAASRLGIKRESLYAYVSRGRVRSSPVAGSRSRRYLRADVERLRARHEARSGHGPVAASALRWGEPVLDSAITSIRGAGHTYRGHDAIALASGGAWFESVSETLWADTSPNTPAPSWPRVEATIRVGGTIAHHHGIGRVRRAWLEKELGPGGLVAMRALKRALDPSGFMNPGALLPD
jgi:hypothetical protein